MANAPSSFDGYPLGVVGIVVTVFLVAYAAAVAVVTGQLLGIGIGHVAAGVVIYAFLHAFRADYRRWS